MKATRLIAAAVSIVAFIACSETDIDDGNDVGLDCDAEGMCEASQEAEEAVPQAQPPQPWEPPSLTRWPGSDSIVAVDPDGEFGGNMSDMYYERGTDAASDVMWAVKNSPGRLYRLTMDDAGLWQRGVQQSLRFTDGTGDVDAEGVTRAEADSTAMYVGSERDNLNPLVSRLSVLRYDTAVTGDTVSATHEWDLTADLPAVYANAGFEALTWVPDSFLVARGFIDENTGEVYQPSQYASHGTGLFFAGLEANGIVYVYALDHTDESYTRIASFESGHESIMSLYFDRDVGYLWSQCDNECDNRVDVLAIDPTGSFVPRGHFERPATLENLNNEGIAFAPEARCVDGRRAFFWIDDGVAHGHAMRADTIPCGSFLP